MDFGFSRSRKIWKTSLQAVHTTFHIILYVSMRSSMEFCLLTWNWVSLSLPLLLGLEINPFLILHIHTIESLGWFPK